MGGTTETRGKWARRIVYVVVACFVPSTPASSMFECPSFVVLAGSIKDKLTDGRKASKQIQGKSLEETTRIPLHLSTDPLEKIFSGDWQGPHVAVSRDVAIGTQDSLHLGGHLGTGEQAIRREAALDVLRSSGELGTRDFDGQLQVASALATLFNLGKREDAEAFRNIPSQWKRRFPETYALVLGRLEGRHRQRDHAASERVLSFASSVFRDTARLNPDIAYHTRHSARVAELVVEMVKLKRRREHKPPLSGEQIRRLRIAVLVHDLGKAFWPDGLIRKQNRVVPAHARDLRERWRVAYERGVLTSEHYRNVTSTLRRLNTRISPNGTLKEVRPEDRKVLDELRARELLTPEEMGQLTAENWMQWLSPQERALINRHVDGYQVLMVLRPNGLEAPIAQLHHEPDYPFQVPRKYLNGKDLGRLIQMTSVADKYDAFTQPRPNSPAGKSREEGIEALRTIFGSKLRSDYIDLLEEVTRKRIHRERDILLDPR